MKPVTIIAEIGQAHEGSLGIAHSYIDAAASVGANVVKFQTHIAEAESSEFEPFRVRFSYEDETRFDYWKRMEFTVSEWQGLKDHCETLGVEFMSSPFSCAAVELLEEIGVARYKIGSGETSNHLMLERIIETGKSIILSSGLSSFHELDKTVAFLRGFGADFSILQCTTKYPTEPEDLGLNVIMELRSRYGCSIGFSDHSGSIYPAIAATTLGAELLEVHLTFDRQMFGPDASSSLTVKEFAELVRGVRLIERALQSPVDKNHNESFVSLKKIFEKSLAVNQNLAEGALITRELLESKKPAGRGHPAVDYAELIGKRTNRALNKWDFISSKDIKS
jgi:N,N'-diacetyllegionaminate synthase